MYVFELNVRCLANLAKVCCIYPLLVFLKFFSLLQVNASGVSFKYLLYWLFRVSIVLSVECSVVVLFLVVFKGFGL